MFIYTEKELNTAVLNFNKALELISYLKDIDSIKEAVRYQKINILIHLSKAHIYLGNLILAENSLKISKRLLDQIYENFKQKALSFSILTQSYSHILAQFYSHIGKFKEADQLFSNILNTVSATYSNNEDRINIIKIRMSCNSYISGNIQLAKDLLEETSSYWGNLNNSYWHWFSKLNLARIYELEGDQDKALLFTKESVDLAKKYYKEKLRDSMTFTLSRAENWTKKNKYTNTIFWKKTLELTIQLFGENHYQTARYHQLYGQALSNTQQFKKAIEQYEKAMAILKAEEIRHPDLIKFQQQNLKTLQELIKESISHL